MDETGTPDTLDERRAVGRIRVVAGYFGFCAIASAALTLYALVAVAVPSLGLRHGKATTLRTDAALAVLAAGTWGFARTYMLLRRHKREGAYVASVCLAAWLVATLWAHIDNWSGIIIPGLGLVFLALGWHELERGS